MACKNLHGLDPPYWLLWYCSNLSSFFGGSALQKQCFLLGNLTLALSCLGCSLPVNCMVSVFLHFFRSLFRCHQFKKAFPNLKQKIPSPFASHTSLFFFTFDTIKNCVIFFISLVVCLTSVPHVPHQYHKNLRALLMFTTLTQCIVSAQLILID